MTAESCLFDRWWMDDGGGCHCCAAADKDTGYTCVKSLQDVSSLATSSTQKTSRFLTLKCAPKGEVAVD